MTSNQRYSNILKAAEEKQLRIFLTDNRGATVEEIKAPSVNDIQTLTNNGLEAIYDSKHGYCAYRRKTFVLFDTGAMQ